MTIRPLQALLLPPAEGAVRLLDALAAALDGTGPALLPLDPALPPSRVSALLAAFRPATVETADGISRWEPPAPGSPVPGRVLAGGMAGRGVPPEVAVVIATSGSTGEPKGVQLTAAALTHSARASLDRLGAGPGERWLCPLPVSHIAGIGVLARSLLAGTRPVVTGRLTAGTDLASLGCRHVSLVPTQLARLLAEGAAVETFGTILLGGAAVPSGLLDRAREAGANVVTSYGMSETCGGCVYDGVALDGVRVSVDGGGRIRIAGPVLFAGYRGRPDLTEQAMDGGWLVTSDLGALDDAGRLTVRGRADEMINTGGEKVAPDEVAGVLGACPGVREAVVIGVADPEWGQRVTAIVVPEDRGEPPGLDEVRAFVRRVMPSYAAPRELVLVREIPLLPSGKPDLAALRGLVVSR
jgi:o-succinylbenzoate---CoA ligase